MFQDKAALFCLGHAAVGSQQVRVSPVTFATGVTYRTRMLAFSDLIKQGFTPTKDLDGHSQAPPQYIYGLF